jgi:hypothetical protein
LNARTALLCLFVTLTVVLASTTVYESGTRTTLTSTSTSTSTLTQTTTVTSTTRLTTALFSSVLLGNTALVLNSSDHLGLSLQAEPDLNGNYTFTVRVSNLLNSVNNVTEADEWNPTQDSLNPCGPPGSNPVEFSVVQGHYGQNNYTSSVALPFYNTAGLIGCVAGGGGSGAYAFQPLSDSFLFPSGSTIPEYASATISTSGYWTGGRGSVAAAFIPFSPGVYTVIGADEWGDVVLLQAFLE